MTKKTKIILIVIASLLVIGIAAALIFFKPGDTKKPINSEISSTSSLQNEESVSSETASKTSSSSNQEPAKEGNVGIENITAERGKTISVPVNISNNPGIMASALKIEYDSQKLTYIGYDEGEVFENYLFKEEKDGILFSNIENKNSTKNGVMFYLKFKVKDNAQLGDSDIKVNATDESFVNFDEEFVKVSAGQAKITIN